ncbi:hypothetical protein HDV00_001692 [Rhizophlyctis rosea]|nr:hypothetical protein HDV00_001692 [Rhizophlyctis rosea]
MLVSYFERVVHNKPVGQIREDPSTGQLWEDATGGMSIVDISEWTSNADLASSLGLEAEAEGMSPAHQRDGSPSAHEGEQDHPHHQEGPKSSGSPGRSSATMDDGHGGEGSHTGASDDTQSAGEHHGAGASTEGSSSSGKQNQDRDRPSNGTDTDDGATTTGGSAWAPSPHMTTAEMDASQHPHTSYSAPPFQPYQSHPPPSHSVPSWYDPMTRYDPYSSGSHTSRHTTPDRNNDGALNMLTDFAYDEVSLLSTEITQETIISNISTTVVATTAAKASPTTKFIGPSYEDIARSLVGAPEESESSHAGTAEPTSSPPPNHRRDSTWIPSVPTPRHDTDPDPPPIVYRNAPLARRSSLTTSDFTHSQHHLHHPPLPPSTRPRYDQTTSTPPPPPYPTRLPHPPSDRPDPFAQQSQPQQHQQPPYPPPTRTDPFTSRHLFNNMIEQLRGASSLLPNTSIYNRNVFPSLSPKSYIPSAAAASEHGGHYPYGHPQAIGRCPRPQSQIPQVGGREGNGERGGVGGTAIGGTGTVKSAATPASQRQDSVASSASNVATPQPPPSPPSPTSSAARAKAAQERFARLGLPVGVRRGGAAGGAPSFRNRAQQAVRGGGGGGCGAGTAEFAKAE